MKVLIYEPSSPGHRFHYVSLIVPALLEIDCEVHLATTRLSVQSKEFEIHLAGQKNDFQICEIPEGLGAAPSKKFEANRFVNAISKYRPDHLLVPTASRMSSSLALRFAFRKSFADYELPAEGLHMGPGFGYRMSIRRDLSNRIRQELEKRLPWTRYGHIDPFQLKTIAGKNGGDRFQMMPDPAPVPPDISRQEARRHFGIPESGRYVGCTGAITIEKGIIDLIDAFRIALPRLAEDDRLLLAGFFSQKIRDYVRDNCSDLINSKRMICIDRHLTEYEMDIVMSAFDLICAAQHGRPGSSGIVVRAAAAGVAVLARDKYWSGRIVPMFKLGWTFRTRDVNSFAESIASSLQKVDSFQPSPESKRYIKFQSVGNFQAHWTELIRQRKQLGSHPELLRWERVVNPSEAA